MTDLFLKLLNMSITASWLIAAVILVRLLLQKAPKWISCVLWALVAVRLICPFSFESNLSLVPDVELAGQSVIHSVANADIEMDETTGKIEFVESEPVYDSTIETMPNTDNLNNGSAPQANRLRWAAADIAAAIWLVGMAALLLYALISYLRLRRKVSAAMLLRESIWLCDGVESPFILGLFRPRIYLPSSIAEGDMGHVVAHERAHLQRHDHWWKPLGFVLLAVYWFNPLIWVAYILLCRDIELACDEKVIRSPDVDRKGYSEALLHCSVKRSAITACPLAFGEVSIRGRIKSVLNYKKPVFWVIIAALVACIVLAVCFLTDPVKPTGEDVEEQNGYGITKITTDVAMMVNIPLDVLPDDLYAYTLQDPYVYEKGEVVLWQSETTTLWLESVGYEERKNDVVFDCEFSYEILDRGTIRTLTYPEIKDGITIGSHSTDGIGSRGVFDSNNLYPDAAYLRGSNWGLQFCMAVDADVVRQASGYVAFWVWQLNEISYAKGSASHENDIEMSVSSEYLLTDEDARQARLEFGREIASNFGNVPNDYWAYYNDEIDDAIGFYECILVRKQLDLSYGDKVPTYFLSPDRKTLIAVKQDKEGNNYSWTFVKKAAEEWVLIDSRTKQSDQSVPTTGNVDGPENLTVTAEDASIGAAMIDAVEKLLAGKLSATISKMDPEGRIHPVAGRINAWDCANAVNRCKGILAHTFQEVDALETSDALIILEFTVDGTDWGIIFYDGTDSVSVWDGGTEYLLQATPDHEDIFLSPLGALMRKWYDEAEFQFLREQVDVIPNTGQSYLEAALEFCEAYESVHLAVSSGSHYRYNEIFCRVEAAESATALYREQGEIGENTYAFYAYTAFVAESERALQHSMAGNTGAYEGNDPNVPEEAFEYTRCGYITLEDDGWHGTIAGTSF